MDPRAYLLDAAGLVDAGLDAALPAASEPPERLHAAMRHLVFPGGKRLRPGLACAAAEAVGGTPDVALPVGVGVELVHTWTLVHDDLPCMDDDDLRRGQPTSQATLQATSQATSQRALRLRRLFFNERSISSATIVAPVRQKELGVTRWRSSQTP